MYVSHHFQNLIESFFVNVCQFPDFINTVFPVLPLTDIDEKLYPPPTAMSVLGSNLAAWVVFRR